MARVEEIESPVERARCEAIPALGDFVASIDTALATDPGAVWRCTDAFLALTRTRFMTELIRHELDCLRGDPEYVPCPRGERDLEVIHLGPLALSIRLQRPDDTTPSGFLYGFSEHHLSANVGPGTLRVERWVQAWTGPPEIFDRTKRLSPMPVARVSPGEHARFEAHRDVARITAIDDAAVVIGLTRVQATRIRWVYDESTLLPIRAEAADLSAARLDYAMRLLAMLDHRDAAPTIASLYEHPDHFVRWSAVCRTMALDQNLGRPLVERALSDVHPHVRRAAERSIERLAQQATATS